MTLAKQSSGGITGAYAQHDNMAVKVCKSAVLAVMLQMDQSLTQAIKGKCKAVGNAVLLTKQSSHWHSGASATPPTCVKV